MVGTWLNQLMLNIFDGGSWANFFSGLWAFIGRIFYAIVIVAIGRLADICQLIFRKLAGISSTGVNMDGNIVEGDIVLAFIQSSIVRNLFFSLLILAIIILLITTFVAVIKTEFNKDGNNNKRKVIKNAFRGLANFLLVPIICMFGIIISNALLKAIDGATGGGENSTLSSQIFVASGYNANRARRSETNDGGYVKNSFGDKLQQFGNFGVFVDDDPVIPNPRRASDKIDSAFSHNWTIKVGEAIGSMKIKNGVPLIIPGANYAMELNADSNVISYNEAGIWYGGEFATDIQITSFAMDGSGSVGWDAWTTNGSGVIQFVEGQTIQCSLYNIGLVYYYYDLTIGGFDYIIALITLVFCAWTLLMTAIGLVKRLFMLTTLFVISAPICAIYPLDDGKALGNWRTEFIKETLSAYSIVIIMNIFLSLLPLMLKINLFASWMDLCPLPIPTGLANYLGKLLIVIGALAFFKDATKIVSGIIGAGDAYGDGASAAKSAAATIGKVALGGALVAGGVRSAARGVKGAIDSARMNHFARKQEKEYVGKMTRLPDADTQAQNDAKKDAENAGGAANPAGSAGGDTNSMNNPANAGADAGANGANASGGTEGKGANGAGGAGGQGTGGENSTNDTQPYYDPKKGVTPESWAQFKADRKAGKRKKRAEHEMDVVSGRSKGRAIKGILKGVGIAGLTLVNPLAGLGVGIATATKGIRRMKSKSYIKKHGMEAYESKMQAKEQKKQQKQQLKDLRKAHGTNVMSIIKKGGSTFVKGMSNFGNTLKSTVSGKGSIKGAFYASQKGKSPADKAKEAKAKKEEEQMKKDVAEIKKELKDKK